MLDRITLCLILRTTSAVAVARVDSDKVIREITNVGTHVVKLIAQKQLLCAVLPTCGLPPVEKTKDSKHQAMSLRLNLTKMDRLPGGSG